MGTAAARRREDRVSWTNSRLILSLHPSLGLSSTASLAAVCWKPVQKLTVVTEHGTAVASKSRVTLATNKSSYKSTQGACSCQRVKSERKSRRLVPKMRV